MKKPILRPGVARGLSREQTWELVRAFVREWSGKLEPAHGCASVELDAAERRLGIHLPLALREGYELAGRHPLGRHVDAFLKPDEIRLTDELLVFRAEAQNAVRWGIRRDDLSRPDPPVVIDLSPPAGREARTIVENETTSQFFFQALVSEARLLAPFSIMRNVTDDDLARIADEYFDLGLPAWHWPDERDPSVFVADEETVLSLDPGRFVVGGARTKDAMGYLVKLLELDWSDVQEHER